MEEDSQVPSFAYYFGQISIGKDFNIDDGIFCEI